MGDWIVTGICPDCSCRSITVGRCLSCSWESKLSKLKAEKSLILDKARNRMLSSEDERMLAYDPTEFVWMHDEELERLQAIDLEIIAETPTSGEIRERLRMKRAERRRKAGMTISNVAEKQGE